MPNARWGVWLLVFGSLAGGGELVFETPRLRAVLGDDAAWRALVDKASGRDLCPKAPRIAFAAAQVGGHTRQADRAALDGDRLTIGFAGCDTRLTYRVAAAPGWLSFRLVEVAGTRPSQLTLVRLGVAITDHVGRRLSIAWNADTGVCLVGANLQTHGWARRRGGGYAELNALTQDEPGPRLEGSAAALVVAPMAELRPILHRLSVACDLPRNCDAHGTPSKELPLARRSYWFLSFGEADVDKVVDYCKRIGFRQVMMGSGSWCRTVGHYTFRTDRYPDGIESLRRTVARLHRHGIVVGMHCFASKVSKTDAYVTPVPDRRFWVDMTATLAADLGPAAATVRTASDLSQWPGSPACKKTRWEGGVVKHQEVLIDDEIIRYKAIGPEGKWDTFVGCERGAWKTRATAHKAGTSCRHYGVDGCINGYIIDQETSLLAEAHDRLAHVFNTCGFDMVYFDGGEDVDRRRFYHYSSKFQASAMSRFRKRPLLHMGTCFCHNVWHSFTRSSTVDHYLNTIRGRIISGAKVDTWPTVRDHIDRSVRYMLSVREDLVPGELGWFGIWPKGRHTDGLQLDETEYLLCKSLAYDAPISLQTSFATMEAHPLTPGILEIVRAYEQLRLRGVRPKSALARLEPQGQDFILFRDGRRKEPVDFVPAEPLPQVGGTHDLRSCLGPRGDGAVATLWHYTGKPGKLFLDGCAGRVTAFDIFGERLDVGRDGGSAVVPFGHRRTTLLFEGMAAEAVRERLAAAKIEVRKPVCLWIRATDFRRAVGEMAKGADVGVREPEALGGDVVVCTARPNREKPSHWYCEYTVRVPHKGVWTLWARVRYTSGGDESFGIVRPGEKLTLAYNQVLGNCGRNEKKWHWTGRGGGSGEAPPGRRVSFRLRRGRFTFRVHAREGGGTPATNPRLDCLCLTDDPAYLPTDDAARAALGRAER